MLTSFFRKSKPINFLFVGLFAVIAYILYNFSGDTGSFSWSFLVKKTAFLLVYLTTLFLTNFTLRKTKPEERHTFALFFFALFTLGFPPILTHGPTILAGVFTVLGLRRTLALQTGHALSQKVFDAFFFLGLATLFFPSTAIFMLVPVLGLVIFSPNNYKFWLIPFVSIFTVFILQTAFSLLVYDTFFNPVALFDFNFSTIHNYIETNQLWFLIVLIVFSIWTLFGFLINLSKSTQKEKYAGYLLGISFLAGLAIVFLFNLSADNFRRTGSELLFLIIPACLIGGKYFENKGHPRLKEIFLLTLTGLCLFFAIYFS